jgi:hypothetical protein
MSLVRVAHGVWRPPSSVADDLDRITALMAACPEDSVICGLSAARIHGLWLPPGIDTPLEVVVHPAEPVPRRRAHGRRTEIVTHRYVLDSAQTVLRHGMPVTDVARTWFDLARVLSMPDLVAAGDSALRGLTTVQALVRTVDANSRRAGITKARAALPLLNPRSRSRPESHLRYALASAGMCPPLINEPIYTEDGEWLAEPDAAYDDVRIALEYNGAMHADLDRMHRDITRELDMSDRGGWLTVTFGPVQVFRRPDQIPLTVGRLRRERAHIAGQTAFRRAHHKRAG